MRPGRFDRKIYLGANSGEAAKVQIFRAQTRKFNLSPCVDLPAVVRFLEQQRGVLELTGADIGSITSSAFSIAMDRTLEELAKEAILSRFSTTNGNVNDQMKSSLRNKMDKMTITSLLFSENSIDNLNMDSKEIISCIKSFIDGMPSSKLKVLVTQKDLLAAANKCKPTFIDKKYYERLLSKYEDDQIDL